MSQWLRNTLIAFDQWVGSLFPRSLPGQTISARAGTARDNGHLWGCVLCRFLDWLDPNHCTNAIAHDKERAQAVIDDLS